VTRPAATIIVPLLRQRDDWLAHAVRSALAQTVPCEVLVVPCPATPASNHQTLAHLQAGAAGRLVVREGPRGFAAQLNVGFRTATADRVGLLLSDDWLEPTALEECLGSQADIVSTGKRAYSADGATEFASLRRFVSRARFEELATLEERADYLTHFFLFRRRKVLEVGGADETLGDAPGIDDYDLVWVLLEHGATVAIVERLLYSYRDHGAERLTLRPREELLLTLGRILSKHGIEGAARERLLTVKAHWLGRPVHVARAELQAAREAGTGPVT
jgi:GT2 family glycosyltransferase